MRESGRDMEYIGPMMAQAAMVGGAAAVYDGGGVVIGGARLIGPAGKTYAFRSADSAAMWVEHTLAMGVREVAIIGGLAADAALVWKAKKREKLAVIAGRVANAAARQGDAAKRAALVAESAYCLQKWSE